MCNVLDDDQELLTYPLSARKSVVFGFVWLQGDGLDSCSTIAGVTSNAPWTSLDRNGAGKEWGGGRNQALALEKYMGKMKRGASLHLDRKAGIA